MVRGEGEARSLPDRATIRVTVDGEAESRDEAFARVARSASVVDAVLARFSSAIVRNSTAALIVQPRSRWKKGEAVRTGWQAMIRPRPLTTSNNSSPPPRSQRMVRRRATSKAARPSPGPFSSCSIPLLLEVADRAGHLLVERPQVNDVPVGRHSAVSHRVQVDSVELDRLAGGWQADEGA